MGLFPINGTSKLILANTFMAIDVGREGIVFRGRGSIVLQGSGGIRLRGCQIVVFRSRG